MPFCKLSLNAERPRDLPRGYPLQPCGLGDHLRRTRLDLGLRQRDLAARLGVRTETVANWERGGSRPLARHRAGVLRFLGGDPEPPPTTLAGRLKATRYRLGLTQEQMANRLGLDEGSVSRWESGSRRPTQWMAARLAALLEAIEHAPGSQPNPQDELSYFDRTRWRRSPPPDLLSAQPATLGERIRAARLERGLSQRAAGKFLGVDRATLYRWESGKELPPPRRRAAVAKFIGNHGRR